MAIRRHRRRITRRRPRTITAITRRPTIMAAAIGEATARVSLTATAMVTAMVTVMVTVMATGTAATGTAEGGYHLLPFGARSNALHVTMDRRVEPGGDERN